MIKLLVHWVLSALCLLLVANFVPGFIVSGFGTALPFGNQVRTWMRGGRQAARTDRRGKRAVRL